MLRSSCTPRYPGRSGTLWRHSLEVLKAVRFVHALVMQRVMLPARHHLQVFWAVVVADTVEVVAYFTRQQRAPQGFFQHQNVRAHVTSVIRAGVFRLANKHVPLRAAYPTSISGVGNTAPRVFRASHMCGIVSYNHGH